MPPLGLPPASLKVAPLETSRAVPLRAWIAMVVLFVLGTTVSYLLQQ